MATWARFQYAEPLYIWGPCVTAVQSLLSNMNALKCAYRKFNVLMLGKRIQQLAKVSSKLWRPLPYKISLVYTMVTYRWYFPLKDKFWPQCHQRIRSSTPSHNSPKQKTVAGWWGASLLPSLINLTVLRAVSLGSHSSFHRISKGQIFLTLYT